MTLKGFLHRLTAPSEVLHEENLRLFCAGRPGVVAIGDLTVRREATIVGEIASVRTVPRPAGSPWLEATITDGTGKLVALWTGRRGIAGVKSGKRLVLTGRPSASGPRGRLLLYNPRYELL